MTAEPKDSTYYTKEQKRGEVTPGEETTGEADIDEEDDASPTDTAD